MANCDDEASVVNLNNNLYVLIEFISLSFFSYDSKLYFVINTKEMLQLHFILHLDRIMCRKKLSKFSFLKKRTNAFSFFIVRESERGEHITQNIYDFFFIKTNINIETKIYSELYNKKDL